jgi:hypothetical protein
MLWRRAALSVFSLGPDSLSGLGPSGPDSDWNLFQFRKSSFRYVLAAALGHGAVAELGVDLTTGTDR